MNPHFRNLALWAIIGLLVVALVMLFQQPGQRTPIRDISYSELLTQIDQGRVHDVTIAGNEIVGHFNDNRPFTTYAPDDANLVPRLQAKNVSISAKPARSKISRPCSGWLKRNRTKAHSVESWIEKATMRTLLPSNRRTTSNNWPTRFSRNTVNCRIEG